jgi:hypothetical protein
MLVLQSSRHALGETFGLGQTELVVSGDNDHDALRNLAPEFLLATYHRRPASKMTRPWRRDPHTA